jgi:hypothetical protein
MDALGQALSAGCVAALPLAFGGGLAAMNPCYRALYAAVAGVVERRGGRESGLLAMWLPLYSASPLRWRRSAY